MKPAPYLRTWTGTEGWNMARPINQLKRAGMTQDDLFLFLQALAQDFRDLTEKLDADGGITDTDYEALLNTAASLTYIEGLNE